MSEADLRDAVFQKMQKWIDENFYRKSQILSMVGNPNWMEGYRSFTREYGILWDEKLNTLGIRRVEHHLKRPTRKGHIRIGDPFMVGPNRRRDLEMTSEQAEKILFLGIP